MWGVTSVTLCSVTWYYTWIAGRGIVTEVAGEGGVAEDEVEGVVEEDRCIGMYCHDFHDML